MDFKARMQADLASCLSPAEFGTLVTWLPASGEPVEIRGIFDLSPVVVDPESGAAVLSETPTLLVREADLPAAPARGDRVVIDGVTYTANPPERDGQGGATFTLQEAG